VLETRAQKASGGWQVLFVPPFGALPTIRFTDCSDTLNEAGKSAVLLSAWAGKRSNIAAFALPCLISTPSDHPLLAERRAQAVAELLPTQGISAVPAPAAGRELVLASASAQP
jgi:hypothetical protein